MNKVRGITLVEVLIAVAIVATLVVVLWFVLGPASKGKAIEARIRSELTQIHLAMNLYREDYDGQLPTNFESLTRHVGKDLSKPEGIKELFPECGVGTASYSFLRNRGYLMGEKSYQPIHPFELGKNPYVKAGFYCRLTGARKTFLTYGNPKQMGQPVTVPEILSLGILESGRIGWFDQIEQWQFEFMDRNRYVEGRH